MPKFKTGERVYHSRRREYATVDPMPGAPDTVWVTFDGADDSEEVSRVHLLRESSEATAIKTVNRLNAAHDADLTVSDLQLIDGVWTIDGMPPEQWAEAMHGDTEQVNA